MANRFLSQRRCPATFFAFCFPNTLSVFFGRALSIAASLLEILNIRGLPYFSGSFRVSVWFLKSRSVHFRRQASPYRTPVSLRSWRKAASFLLAPLMSRSSSDSRGMNGSFLMTLHLGGVHVPPLISRNLHACSGERSLCCSWVILAVAWARPYSVQHTSPNRIQVSSCPRHDLSSQRGVYNIFRNLSLLNLSG